MIKRHGVMLFLLLLLTLPFGSTSLAFTSIVSFGDSLTDNGPDDGAGYTYFTNTNPSTGTINVWVEFLNNQHYGMSLLDVAYGGATTGYDNPPLTPAGYGNTGLQWQVDTYGSGLNLTDALTTVWAGANDFFFNVRSSIEAAQNIGNALDKLADSGDAKTILVANLPDIGLTPGYYSQGTAASAAATQWSMDFNNELINVLNAFVTDPENDDVSLYFLDTFSAFGTFIETNANGEITNVNEWLSYFNYIYDNEDGVHPSHLGHQLIADTAFQVLQGSPYAAVPIPGTFLLLMGGLIGIAGLKRKQ